MRWRRRWAVDPVADRAEVVAEVHLAGRLDPREHACHDACRLPVAPCPAIHDGASGRPAGSLSDVPYEVPTPVFEGPFDLLLHLILKEEVDLWEVSLARIVDAFLAELERMRAALDLESRPSSC